MCFASIAQPFVKLGIPVFPLTPGEKVPPKGLRFLQEATTDPARVEAWAKENPDYNVGLLANGEFCFLEFDVKAGMKTATAEMGESVPQTRAQKSGRGYGHYIFRHTDRSRKLGNRSANLPDGKEWFSFRAHNKYLVGAGSLHPSGIYYKTVLDVDPIPVPEWVCDFIEKHSESPRPKSCKGACPVSEAFDFDDFCEHYGIAIRHVKDDVWHVVEECPGVGYRHEQSTLTAFYFDGETLGWSCFAQGCPTHEMTIGQLVGLLNKTHGPYPGIIWERQSDAELLAGWDVEPLDAAPEAKPAPEQEAAPPHPESPPTAAPRPEPVVPAHEPQRGADTKAAERPPVAPPPEPAVPPAAPPLAQIDDEFADLESQIPLLVPQSIAIEDPHGHTGSALTCDCAMYGKLKAMAKRLPRLPEGWLYPSMLAVASTLRIRDTRGNVHSNAYVALLGDVGLGKSACMEAARLSLPLPDSDGTIVEEVPSSDRGLANVLSEERPVPPATAPSVLLMLDEGSALMAKGAIQGSALTQMMNQLWSKENAGVTDKKGRAPCYGKLSMLINLTCKDPSEFAALFGSATVKGLYDRLLFGYASEHVKYRPPDPKPEIIAPEPVGIPDWVWEAKDNWMGDIPERRRLGEHVLRIALVTAAVNGDQEVTKECFEAALRFMEWQQRLRAVYRPGLAETKEAECYEAVYAALRERHKKQQAENFVHKKAKDYAIDMNEAQQWRLLYFTQAVNSKSYYRKYGGLIDRVRKSMVDNEIIAEVREVDEDEQGRKKKGRRTPFVILTSKLE